LNLTKNLKSGEQILEIQIPDHIILTSEAYFSFADEGLIGFIYIFSFTHLISIIESSF